MYKTIPDILRKSAIDNMFATNVMKKCWPIWNKKVKEILGNNYDENDLINLGDHLTEIFRTTGEEGRDQGDLSAGGTAWESLVCWYINICTVGSRVVAFKKMSLVPEPIRNAITVNYGNFSCNTESDITIVVFPDIPDYNQEIEELKIFEKGNLIEVLKKGKLSKEAVDFLVKRDFDKIEIGIVQCKTNWNDNAQVPMLWDMIYSANGFKGRNITIGKDGFNIHDASNFTYSFVTVPSNRRTTFKSDGVAVRRVTNLSGGNYWGLPTSQNIARSLKEIFTNNFQSGFRTNMRADIKGALNFLNEKEELEYFRIY